MNNMESLASRGLRDINFKGKGNTKDVGTDPKVIKEVVSELTKQGNNMHSFAENLLSTEQKLTANWESGSSETLKKVFPKVIESFESIKPCLESIANWAQTASDNYSREDVNSSENFSAIFGGAR